jgi:hypothetical protein
MGLAHRVDPVHQRLQLEERHLVAANPGFR